MNNKVAEKLFLMVQEGVPEKKCIDFYNQFVNDIDPQYSYFNYDMEYPVYLTFFCNKNQYNNLLSLLIDNSPDFNYNTVSGTTLLLKLIDDGKWNLVEKILLKEQTLNDEQKTINRSRDYYFDTALVALIKNKKENLAVLAVKSGANYDFYSSENNFGNIEKESLDREMNTLVKQIIEQRKIDAEKEAYRRLNNPTFLEKIIDKIKGVKNQQNNNIIDKNNKPT